VVSTTLPTGVAIVNRDGETGLTVPPGDAGALASAMTRLLDDRAFADACGTRARTRVQTHFSREAMVSATMALYRAVGRV
jgi:glycosyltransferase involved in cell wall biosynthesis